jgi:hypothetical protein
MRDFQEACVRKLWMTPLDRYNLGVTFHETTVRAVVNSFQGLEPLHYPYGPPGSATPQSLKGGSGSGWRNRGKSKPLNETTVCSHLRISPNITPPEFYLGQCEQNEYPPVGVTWRSDKYEAWGDEQRGHRKGLYWSPKHLDIPSISEFVYPQGDYPESQVSPEKK